MFSYDREITLVCKSTSNSFKEAKMALNDYSDLIMKK